MLTVKIIFWFFVLVMVYAYFGYPLLLSFYSIFAGRKNTAKADIFPHVSLIILVSDIKKLKEKIENCLLLEYPKDKIEIIVASFEISGPINNIVSNYYKKGIKLFYHVEKKTRNDVINQCVIESKGEIVVITDSESMIDKYGVKNLMRNFADESVGIATGEVRNTDRRDDFMVRGENLYIRYKKRIIGLAGRLRVLTIVNSELYAVRKQVYTEIKEGNAPDNIALPLSVLKKKLKVVYEPLAIVNKEINTHIRANYESKVNEIKNNLYSFKFLKKWIFSFRPIVLTQLLSYNVLVFGSGLLMALIFLMNVIVLVVMYYFVGMGYPNVEIKNLYWILLLFQLLFYSSLLIKVSHMMYYYTFMALASLTAVFKSIFRGKTDAGK